MRPGAAILAVALALAGCEQGEPAAPKPAAFAEPAPMSADQAFAQRMMDLDFYVAEAGRLAADQSSNPEVRALGEALTREHDMQAGLLAAARKAAAPRSRTPACPPRTRWRCSRACSPPTP